MKPSPPAWLRRLARLAVRGPEAPYVLADLDEAFVRDLARGRTRSAARRRYLRNALSSAAHLVITGRAFSLGLSRLDVKLGVRMLAKQPALTLVAVFALSIGIPVGLLPQHMLHSLMAPPPVPDGEEVVMVVQWDLRTSDRVRQQLHDFSRWREELSSFASLGVATSRLQNLTPRDGPAAPISGADVTAAVFETLRVQPSLGRVLVEADEVPGASDVVVVGHDVWRSRLAADPEVIGKTVRIGGVPHTVVGVMPDGFHFPVQDQFWVPFRHDPADYEWGTGPRTTVLGRLAEGVSIEEADRELAFFGQRMALELPETHAELQARVMPYGEGLVGFNPWTDPDIIVLNVLALLILALACGNVGILILARASTRTGELAVRTALGAGRARIIGQLFFESLLLAVLAAGCGLVLGHFVATGFVASAGSALDQMLEYWIDFGITSRTVVLALGLAVFSAVLAGVVPALKATGRNVQLSMQRHSGNRSGIRFGAVSTALVVAEVACAVCFLSVSAGLVPSALSRAGGLGIDTERYVRASVLIPSIETRPVTPTTPEHRTRVAAAHLELARRLPEAGLGRPAFATSHPGMLHSTRFVEVEGEPAESGRSSPRVGTTNVDVDYFRALGQPILGGRDFDQADLAEGLGAVIVNTGFRDQRLGGRDPIGRHIRYAGPADEPQPRYEIVGMVGPLGVNELNPAADAGIYHVVPPGELHPISFAIEVGDVPTSVVPRIREIVSAVDPTAMLLDPAPLDQVFNANRFLTRWIGLLIGLLSLIAVVLSSAGLYALMSFTVAQRTREIGIRSALGARPAAIVSAIARRAFVQLVVGGGGGAAIAAVVVTAESDDLIQLRFGTWPVVIAVVALAVVLVGMLALVSPTRRGLSVRPMEALRS